MIKRITKKGSKPISVVVVCDHVAKAGGVYPRNRPSWRTVFSKYPLSFAVVKRPRWASGDNLSGLGDGEVNAVHQMMVRVFSVGSTDSSTTGVAG